MSEESRSRCVPDAEVQARLELQWKRTARRLSDTFSGRLRTDVELRFRSQQFRSFDLFVRDLEVPTGSLRFQYEPSGGSFLLEPGPRLLFPMLDRLLGGRHALTVQRRPLTELDRRVALQLSDSIAEAIASTWTEPQPDLVRPLGVECDPQRIRIFPPDEPVIIVSFDVRFETIQATMRLCLPTIAIRPDETVRPESSETSGTMSVGNSRTDSGNTEIVPESSSEIVTGSSGSTSSASSSDVPTSHSPENETVSGDSGPETSPEIPETRTTTSPVPGPVLSEVELSLSLPSVSYDGPLAPGVLLPIPVHEHRSLFRMTLDGDPVFEVTPITVVQGPEYRVRIAPRS
ncbi:MAG: hypothetical protein Q4C47_04900 [Planctomycetia bacterium]|nr:hypothetical protein [Planctomycetia bacterium]